MKGSGPAVKAAVAVICIIVALGISGCGRKAKPEPLRKQARLSSVPFHPEARPAAEPGPSSR